ncbi:neuropeptide F receptor isoform X1 [Hydra vulgaris]|uniref:neuropeptide F receptor isoform X1 n=1 Tax=Hydra vulgaris TaxID=6087 RepID=UPI0002B49BD7|nr:neuropeptide F receptor [Hydra vulgaris]
MNFKDIMLVALNTFLVIGGIVGNLFTVLLISQKKKMQTITNTFVFNLAVADLAISMFVLPLTTARELGIWKVNELECTILLPLLEHFAGVCVLTHAALSLARYYVVSNANRSRDLLLYHAIAIVIFIWIVAFVIISVGLMGIFAKFTLEKNACRLKYLSENRKLVYRLFVYLLTYIIPMLSSGFAYYKIHRTVFKTIKFLKDHMPKETLKCRKRSSRKLDRVIWTMYVFFGLTTLPLQLFYIAIDLKWVSKSIARPMWTVLLRLFYLQIITNPLVLFYMGEEYRKELYKLSVCFCKPKQVSELSFKVRGSLIIPRKKYDGKETSIQ